MAARVKTTPSPLPQRFLLACGTRLAADIVG